MATKPLLAMELNLREVLAFADVLQAIGAGEREVRHDTLYLMGQGLEAIGDRLRDAWQAAVDAERQAP